MGKTNLILIANFAVAKLVSRQSQFFPQKKGTKTRQLQLFIVYVNDQQGATV
jgi:hypothetical protein